MPALAGDVAGSSAWDADVPQHNYGSSLVSNSTSISCSSRTLVLSVTSCLQWSPQNWWLSSLASLHLGERAAAYLPTYLPALLWGHILVCGIALFLDSICILRQCESVGGVPALVTRGMCLPFLPGLLLAPSGIFWCHSGGKNKPDVFIMETEPAAPMPL